MCGRYELHSNPAVVALAFGLAQPPAIQSRYNIAPMQMVPVVRLNAAGERELIQLRWGLVPRWAKDPSIGARMINARAETAAVRGAFRLGLERHRCLVPADGFYEWQVTAAGKRPMRIARRDGAPFGMAGLYERWRSPDGQVLDTCTVLTTQANALLRPLHDRMPVIVPPEAYERWLDVSHADVADLLAPAPDDALQAHAVSTRVNAVRNDDPGLIVPVAANVADPPGRASAGALTQTAADAVHASPQAGGQPPAEIAAEAGEEVPLQERLF